MSTAEPGAVDAPQPLVFLFPPSLGRIYAHVRAELIAEVLSEVLGQPVLVEVAKDYEELERRLSSHDADLVWAPPELCARADPRFVLTARRRGLLTYHSALLCRADGEVRGLWELRGRRAAWVAPSSSAGYRLPRDLIRGLGEDPAAFFGSERFYGSYQGALVAVLEGEADVAPIFVGRPDEEWVRRVLTELLGPGSAASRLQPVAYSAPVRNDGVVIDGRLAEAVASRLALFLARPPSRYAWVLPQVFDAEAFVAADDPELCAPADTSAPEPGSVAEDGSARRLFEQELLLLAAFPLLDPDPALTVRRDGTVAYANPAARKLFPDLFRLGSSHPLLAFALRAAQPSSGAEDGERRVEVAIGGRCYEVRVSVFPDESCLHLRAADVTEKRRMEAQLIEADRRMTLATLAAGIGHEINNPLSYVMANLQFAIDELVAAWGGELSTRAAEILSALQDAKEGAQRVQTIVRDLKTISRGDDQVRLRVDLHRTLESAINIVWHEIRPRARLLKEYGDLPVVEGNDGRLCQVFMNLLLNAAQAMDEGGADRNTLRIVTRRDPDGRAVVEFHDTGKGVPEELRERIFEPFFSTKPVGVGTGLGLSICRTLLGAMGGEITVENGPQRGAIFRVTLPAASSRDARARPLPPAPEAGPSDAHPPRRPEEALHGPRRGAGPR